LKRWGAPRSEDKEQNQEQYENKDEECNAAARP
jgi:hypothetical protein